MWPNYRINGQWYSREQLISLDFNIEDEYLIRALQFCGQWLAGEAAFLQPTSGSTGKPKTIMLHRQQMEASAKFTCRALALQPGMHALVCVNINYIAGKMMLVRCLQQGMQITIVPPSGNPLGENQFDLPLHFAAMVPFQIANTLADPTGYRLFQQIDKVIIGGAAINQKLQELLQHLPNEIYATYGMTETVSHIALQKLNGNDRQEYFEAFPEVKLGQDKRGCLTIQSVLTNQEKLITNDLVNLISAHRFIWLGRADHVINSGGVKIQVDALESLIRNVLAEKKLNLNFVISGQPDEKLGQQVVMVVEVNREPANLKQILEAGLPKYQVPKKIICLPKFAVTASGKIDRQTIKMKINETNI